MDTKNRLLCTSILLVLMVVFTGFGVRSYDDEIAETFSQISLNLSEQGISNNLNEVDSGNVNSFIGLYFKEEHGKITFDEALDLSDEETLAFLQNLENNLNINSGEIAMNVLGSCFESQPAELKFMNLNEMGVSENATSELIFSHLIVKNDNGALIDKTELIPDGGVYIGNASTCEADGSCYTFTFNTVHFTSYELDITPPTTLTKGAPENYTNQQVTINFSCNDHGGSGCERVYYTINGSNPAIDSEYADENSNWQVTIAGDGAYTIKYFGVDTAGNQEGADLKFNPSFVIDTIPPATAADTNGYEAGMWINNNVTIALYAIDSGSGVLKTKYCIDGGSNEPCDALDSDLIYSEPITVSAEGAAYVRYASTDNAGNQETTQNCVEVKIDKTLPELRINYPDSNTYFGSKIMRVDFTAADSNFNYSEVQLYNAAGAVVASQSAEAVGGNTVELIAPSDGVYTIKVTSYDNAGNENSLSVYPLLVDSDNTITVGSENADCTIIQDAIDMAVDGSTISVAAGTYNELVNVNKELNLVGSGAGSTVITYKIGNTGRLENLITINSENIVIEGFTITSAILDLKERFFSGFNGIVLNGYDGITIKNNEIKGNYYGIYINTNSQPLAITEEASKNINIENNSIHGNQDGIYIEAGEGIVVLKNRIYDNPLDIKTGLHNNADSAVDARKNWWGSADGPYEESMNPTGVEGSIFGNIIFSSWCSTEACTGFKTVIVLSDGISDAVDAGILTASDADRENSTNMSVEQELTILVSAGDNNSTVTLPAGTIITMADGTNINASALSAADVSESSLSGLGEGVVVDGALQWGIASHGLIFSQPITLNIFVGASYNGQTLDVIRSVSGNSGWTSDGLSPITCLVANGYCAFTATKASYYAATTYTAPAPAATGSGSGGGGSGGFSCTTTWSCTSWNSCIGGQQTRSCLLANSVCYAATPKPAESQSCTAEEHPAVPTQPVQETTQVMQPVEQPTASDVLPGNQLTGNAVRTPDQNQLTGTVVALGPIKLSQTAAIVSGFVLLAVIAGLVFGFNFVRKKKLSKGKGL